MGNQIEYKKGFTIIEVMLVLAIAGLIFLMVFIAFPALSRTQRDSRRRDDIAILLRKIKDYQTNNRGALPNGHSGTATYNENLAANNSFTWEGLYHDYLGDQFKDPNGSYYTLNITDCNSSGTAGSACTDVIKSDATFSTNMKIIIQATCDGEEAVATNNPRKLAIQYKLEGGGVYCANT